MHLNIVDIHHIISLSFYILKQCYRLCIRNYYEQAKRFQLFRESTCICVCKKREFNSSLLCVDCGYGLDWIVELGAMQKDSLVDILRIDFVCIKRIMHINALPHTHKSVPCQASKACVHNALYNLHSFVSCL